jgi:hypothetical protein
MMQWWCKKAVQVNHVERCRGICKVRESFRNLANVPVRRIAVFRVPTERCKPTQQKPETQEEKLLINF